MKIHTAFAEGNGQTGTEDRSLKHKELASREHTGHGFAFLIQLQSITYTQTHNIAPFYQWENPEDFHSTEIKAFKDLNKIDKYLLVIFIY